MIKKADIALAVFFLLLGGLSFWLTHQMSSPGATVVISADGKEYGTYPLDIDRTVDIQKPDGSRNVVRIQGGQVSMEESNCKNQLCVHQGAISRSNQTIVCLPHRVVVELSVPSTSEEDHYDTVIY